MCVSGPINVQRLTQSAGLHGLAGMSEADLDSVVFKPHGPFLRFFTVNVHMSDAEPWPVVRV